MAEETISFLSLLVDYLVFQVVLILLLNHFLLSSLCVVLPLPWTFFLVVEELPFLFLLLLLLLLLYFVVFLLLFPFLLEAFPCFLLFQIQVLLHFLTYLKI